MRKHLYLSLKQIATLSVFKQQLRRLAYRVETAGPVVAYATVALTMSVKAPDYLKDMLVRAKLQFKGFDNATQPQKPHRESVRRVFALCHTLIHLHTPSFNFIHFHSPSLTFIHPHTPSFHTPSFTFIYLHSP